MKMNFRLLETLNVDLDVYYTFKSTLMNHLDRKCKSCGELLLGRTDQKFCSSYCRSAYHYQKNKEKEVSFYERVDKL